MTIEKKLKYGTFIYTDDLKDGFIIDIGGKRVSLNKIYAFAFCRFAIRIMQRNWYRKARKHERHNK